MKTQTPCKDCGAIASTPHRYHCTRNETTQGTPELLEALKACQKYFDGTLEEGYPIGTKIDEAIQHVERGTK